jgi:hypothetical protein
MSCQVAPWRTSRKKKRGAPCAVGLPGHKGWRLARPPGPGQWAGPCGFRRPDSGGETPAATSPLALDLLRLR